MPFDLEIEFSGLCLYVVEPGGQQVTVLMPDARERYNPNPFHADDTDAVPHVGYLRCNAADLGLSVPGGEDGGAPRYEVVHRFHRQEVNFGNTFSATSMVNQLKFPHFDQFAPGLDLLPGLSGSTPPDILLMRLVLTGGTFASTEEEPVWEIPSSLNGGGSPYSGQFASFAVWTRQVNASDVTLNITDFDGTPQTSLTLSPADGTRVRLKMSNLCAENPLEWDDLPIRQVTGPDNDFRWLYRLLTASTDPDVETLLQNEELLPVPLPADLGGEVGADDCMGGIKTGPIT